jgi:hypothetical protein
MLEEADMLEIWGVREDMKKSIMAGVMMVFGKSGKRRNFSR